MKGSLTLIKGAGDLASGIALRLVRAGFRIVMTELAAPTTLRRTVAFSPAVTGGMAQVEDIRAFRAEDPRALGTILEQGNIAVLVDSEGQSVEILKPDILIDAIIAKKNLGTAISDAPLVIGIGPGFTAGRDCHAVIETQRGHTLGRVYYGNSPCRTALPNTGVPGNIGGFSSERLLRAPQGGIWRAIAEIGDTVSQDEPVAEVIPEGQSPLPVYAAINGILRGILPSGIAVHTDMKCGDIDPRCEKNYCFTVSDKALSIAGGALEAILALSDWQV